MNGNNYYIAVTTNEAESDMTPRDVPFYLRKRYYVVFGLFIGDVLMTLLKINLSIVVVDVTSRKIVTVGNETFYQEPEFHWTPPEKGVILSAYSWGYMFTPIATIISNKLGGIIGFSLGLFLFGILTTLSPFVIQWNAIAFVSLRIIEGFVQGFTTSSLYTALVQWVPPDERVRLVNITFLGMTACAAICYPVIGFISYHLDWRWVFYITGSVTICWSIIIYCTIKNSPVEDKMIKNIEKQYFNTVSEQFDQRKVTIPWKSIITSAPVLAYLNERFVEAWSFSFLLTCLPLYIKDINPTNIKDIGILSSVPHVFSIISTLACAWLADYLRSKQRWSKTKLHKIFIMSGQIPAACILIMVGFWSNFQFAIVAFSIFKICYSPAYTSYFALPIDMSMQHANILITTAVSSKCIANILNPIIMGFMVRNHLPEEWSRYFWFLCIFNLWGAVIFAKFGSGEVQPWARSENSKQSTSMSNGEE